MHVERLFGPAVREHGGSVGRFHSLLHFAVARWPPKQAQAAQVACTDGYETHVPVVTAPLSSERVQARVLEERLGKPLLPPSSWSAD